MHRNFKKSDYNDVDIEEPYWNQIASLPCLPWDEITIGKWVLDNCLLPVPWMLTWTKIMGLALFWLITLPRNGTEPGCSEIQLLLSVPYPGLLPLRFLGKSVPEHSVRCTKHWRRMGRGSPWRQYAWTSAHQLRRSESSPSKRCSCSELTRSA